MAELLANISAYKQYAIGVEASTTIDNLRPSFINARKAVIQVLTKKIYDKVAAKESDTEEFKMLSGALANLTMYNYKVFESVSKRINESKDIYKYELDAMRREYINAFYTYIDSLIELLEGGDTPDTDWKETPLYIEKGSLMVKTLVEFEKYYPIDSSYYFFYRSIYLQKEVLELDIVPALKSETLAADIKSKVSRAVVFLTVAKAVKRLDVGELPSCIRTSAVDPSKAKNLANEQGWANLYAQSLEADAKIILTSAMESIRVDVVDEEDYVNSLLDKSYLQA